MAESKLEVSLFSIVDLVKHNNDYTKRFQVIAGELNKWKHDAMLDGEMVVFLTALCLQHSLTPN